MTQKEMIAYLRRVDEQATGFPVNENSTLEDPDGELELVLYLDRAVHEYSRQLAEARSPLLVKRMSIIDGNPLPEDFLWFCGSVPVNIEGGVIQYYGEAETYGQIGGNPVKYFARLPLVSAYDTTDDLPYNNEQCIKIIEFAKIFAMNKQEFSVSQDMELVHFGGQQQDGNTYQQTQKG